MKTQVHDILDCRKSFTILDKLIVEVITYYFQKVKFEHYHKDCLNCIYPEFQQLLSSFLYI